MIIEKTKLINVSITKLWWQWTTHEGLLTFFGRDNKVELTPGGAYEIYFLMDNPPGSRGGEGNKILSFVPMEMLSFTWNAPPEFPEIRSSTYKTWVVINFKPISENQTEIKLRHLGWPKEEGWKEVYDYFVRAWDLVLEWLGESAKSTNG